MGSDPRKMEDCNLQLMESEGLQRAKSEHHIILQS